MPALVGDKLDFVNITDRAMADDIDPTYTIELALVKSPRLGAKAGAIVIFKAQELNLDMPDKKIDQKALWEMQQEVNKTTESMYRDPIYFRESEGRWIQWAVEKLISLYDELGANARIIIKAPSLKVRQVVSSKSVAHGRSDLRTLFSTAWDIDRLLDRNYKFDPWQNVIRRGRIDAATAKK